MSELKITLTKSTNKVVAKQKATVAALGLKKIGSTVIKADNPQTRGMVNAVAHLVKVEEV